MVMGVKAEKCDASYVLTADNTKKILAILMRFRYDLMLDQNHKAIVAADVTFQWC